MTALEIVNQAAGELGLLTTASVTASDTQTTQLLSLLNAAGNELVMMYPWEQLTEEYTLNTVNGQEDYALPTDWAYFLDQTQWDRTNHWPLMGPKSAQEWQWLKGGLLSQGPRLRYRVRVNRLYLFPTPGTTVWSLAMEYVRSTWVEYGAGTYRDTVQSDADVPVFDPWLLVKFVKLKFFEAKGLNTEAVKSDFLLTLTSTTGKDKGAPILSLAPRVRSILIGPYSVPDGNWPV
jgi:hypothetical protein